MCVSAQCGICHVHLILLIVVANLVLQATVACVYLFMCGSRCSYVCWYRSYKYIYICLLQVLYLFILQHLRHPSYFVCIVCACCIVFYCPVVAYCYHVVVVIVIVIASSSIFYLVCYLFCVAHYLAPPLGLSTK
jgi:hypothetical protein